MIGLKNVRLAAQLIGSLAIVVIAVLSLVPGGLRPHTGAPKQLEHFVAYLLVAAILSFGFSKKHYPAGIALCLSIYSAALEIVQIVVPGRDADFFDFVVSSGGAISGCILSGIVVRALPRAFA